MMDRFIGEQGVLLCQGCGDEYTHIKQVIVGGRPREDGPFVPVGVDSAGAVFEVSDYDFVVATPTECSSVRRDFFTLMAECENCPTTTIISFQQHKGSTYVEARSAIGKRYGEPDINDSYKYDGVD